MARITKTITFSLAPEMIEKIKETMRDGSFPIEIKALDKGQTHRSAPTSIIRWFDN